MAADGNNSADMGFRWSILGGWSDLIRTEVRLVVNLGRSDLIRTEVGLVVNPGRVVDLIHTVVGLVVNLGRLVRFNPHSSWVARVGGQSWAAVFVPDLFGRLPGLWDEEAIRHCPPLPTGSISTTHDPKWTKTSLLNEI